MLEAEFDADSLPSFDDDVDQAQSVLRAELGTVVQPPVGVLAPDGDTEIEWVDDDDILTDDATKAIAQTRDAEKTTKMTASVAPTYQPQTLANDKGHGQKTTATMTASAAPTDWVSGVGTLPKDKRDAQKTTTTTTTTTPGEGMAARDGGGKALSTQLLEMSAHAAASDRVEAATKKARGALDVVVTHFAEPLDWLADAIKVARRIFVYHKGPADKTLQDYLSTPAARQAPWTAAVHWTVTANIGREGHAILQHCLAMKRRKLPPADTKSDDGGPEFTLFLQGALEEHRAMVHTFSEWHRYAEHEYNAVWGEFHTNRGFIDHHERYKQELRDGLMQPTKLTFADYYTLVLGRQFPPSGRVFVSYCNCFSVANTRIMAHAEAFYERAMLSLAAGPNPATGHYFERLSRAIFGGGTPHCPIPFIPIIA